MSGNPCVRTGVLFKVRSDPRCRVGDLFYFGEDFYIRGAPKGFEDDSVCHDIEVDKAVFVERKGGHYEDSGPVRICGASDRFMAHLRNFYPELIDVVIDQIVDLKGEVPNAAR